MSRPKIHIGVKNFIHGPYVFRYTHPDADSIADFRKMLRQTRTTITSTWGYTNPLTEYVTTNNRITSRSYWVFSDECDALQFALAAGELANQVTIWPSSIKFNIYEFT